jgi:hypothetical protein
VAGTAGLEGPLTSLTLYNWLAPACEGRSRNFLDPSLCAEDDMIPPLLTVLHANQRGSLRQLLGMPLRLGGVAEPPPDVLENRDQYIESLLRTPHVDLSTFHLTHLGVSGGFNDTLKLDMLPQTMVSLQYTPAYGQASVRFSSPFAAAPALVQLPNRADIHVCGGSPAVDLIRLQALDGWHAKIEGGIVVMSVLSAELFSVLPSRMFTGMKDVRINARNVTMCHYSRAREEPGFEALVDLLCPPCLDSMEIYSGTNYPTIGQYPGLHAIPNAWRLMMQKMISGYGQRFAFEIDDGLQKRAAWRRWPAPGTREHHAACRLHEAAAAWAGVGS